MVREFSEEKRQEIFRMLDEIDNREWKSFMEWCGSSAEEFGDWPDKLSVSAYTRYVDEYHQKVLELNEMTRQRVNTVFENVAEIDTRYAARMRECQKKIKEQIAIVHTMTEFMQSMTDGNPNMALITKGNENENCLSTEIKNKKEEKLSTQNREAMMEDDSGSPCADITPIIDDNGYVYAGAATLLEVNADEETLILEYLEYQNKLESGEEILKSYLIAEGITDSEKQEEICNIIKEYQPIMLINLCNADRNSARTTEDTAEDVFKEIMDYYNSYYFGKYPYPVAYIEGIIMGYETHKIEDGRFVLDNGGKTIAYGHDIKEGEDFNDGLSMEEGLELAISDLDEKYEDIALCISEINGMTEMNISVNDFTENEMIFLLDFSYNRGRGLFDRPETDENGNPQVNSSLAILIIAVWEKDNETIISTLGEETLSEEGEYYQGLELRRMDEYEILTMGDYKRDYDIERECNGWAASIYRP